MSDLTVFFSVDVETTSTDPHTGRLLTVGIQPVWWDPSRSGSVRAWLDNDNFYMRLDQRDHYPEWFQTLTDRDSTLSWWLKQNDHAQAEAFRDTTLARYDEYTTVKEIAMFVERVAGNLPARNRVFAANPVTFDRAWIDALWTNVRYSHDASDIPKMPFHYRSLCLRSMGFGQKALAGWDTPGRTYESEVPHHALCDALAQAQDLRDLLQESLNAPNV